MDHSSGMRAAETIGIALSAPVHAALKVEFQGSRVTSDGGHSSAERSAGTQNGNLGETLSEVDLDEGDEPV